MYKNKTPLIGVVADISGAGTGVATSVSLSLGVPLVLLNQKNVNMISGSLAFIFYQKKLLNSVYMVFNEYCYHLFWFCHIIDN